MVMTRRWIPVGVCALGLAVLLGGCRATGDRPLQLLSGAGPAYPEAAREQGIEGFVLVRYDISVDGRVVRAQVTESEPPGVFDAAALAAVRSWTFNPAVVDGEPQPESGRVSRVAFKLESTDDYAEY